MDPGPSVGVSQWHYAEREKPTLEVTRNIFNDKMRGQMGSC